MPPDFFVIGAARSGTTSLHHYLSQHPQLCISAVKEPNFYAFSARELAALRGPGSRWLQSTSIVDPARYRALFADARGRLCGEVSPRYLSSPQAAPRIAREHPDARLIAVLRDPVERAWASWLAARRDGWEQLGFLESLADMERRQREGWAFCHLLRSGRYYQGLQPFFAHFPRERLRIFLFRELVADPEAVMRAVFTFLDVDPGVPLNLGRKHNPSGVFSHPLLRVLWAHSELPREWLRPWLPQRWRDAAYHALLRQQHKPRLPPAWRAQVVAMFREDVPRLQELLQRDLSAWLV